MSPALPALSPDRGAPISAVGAETFSESVAVVLLTSKGEIALSIERRRGLSPLVRLPGLAGARAMDSPDRLRRRLGHEAGLAPAELHVMSRYGIPTGDRSNAAILLAPGARRRRGRGLVYVRIEGLAAWLAARRREGWHVDLLVRVGVRLAERHFARWARVRLRRIAEALRAHRGTPRSGGRVVALRPRRSAREGSA
jgi:hypothetical protein